MESILKDDYKFESLTTLHLFSSVKDGVAQIGDIQFIYIFISIAVLILLIASVNYVNLATAKSLTRAKEVGVRKVTGANKFQLISQFLGESILLSSLSYVLAVLIIELILPYIKTVFEIALTFSPLTDINFFLTGFVISILVGIIGGLYPALFLSRFNPIKALRSASSVKAGSGIIRKSLVTFQIIIFSGLLLCTYIIYSQMQYVQNKNLGLEKDQRFIVQIRDPYVYQNANALKDEVLQLSGVQAASLSKSVPTRSNNRYTVQPDQSEDQIWITNYRIDKNFINTLGLEILKGNNLINSTGQVRSALINEAAADALGWENPIGRILPKTDKLGNGEEVEIEYKVTGIVKNFHYESLKEEIAPAFLLPLLDEKGYYLIVKTHGSQIKDVLESTGYIWQDFSQEYSFEYFFLDDAFAKLYQQEQRIANLFNIFTVIALIISILGLFSLTAYTVKRRTREIGIRKVLGATIWSVFGLISKDFIKLTVIGFIIAAPIAWYTMNSWLAEFAYRIDISAWIFVLTGLTTLFIAIITVGWQTIRAALSNPVESLRSE